MDRLLYEAAREGSHQKVEKLLALQPPVNPNSSDEDGWTALHWACSFGHSAIVSPLLSHPAINVNQKDDDRNTPFLLACVNGRAACVRLLLRDPRVILDEATVRGNTPLMMATRWEILVKCWIASGREMDLGEPGNPKTDVVGALRRRNEKRGVISLLERFRENPTRVRLAVRLEIGWFDELAAAPFALVVFVCDGLLRISEDARDPELARFFGLAVRLPMDLQALLCHRVVGSMKTTISGVAAGAAFQHLRSLFRS